MCYDMGQSDDISSSTEKVSRGVFETSPLIMVNMSAIFGEDAHKG